MTADYTLSKILMGHLYTTLQRVCIFLQRCRIHVNIRVFLYFLWVFQPAKIGKIVIIRFEHVTTAVIVNA